MREVVGVRVERSEMRTLLRKQIDGSLLRFAVDAYVGDGVEPDLRGRLDCAEVGQFDSMQEILFLITRKRQPVLGACRASAGS